MPSFSLLPVELQIQILSFVSPWDHPAALRVCSLWNSVISSREIQELRHPIFRSGDTAFRIHWLLYSRFYCNSNCLICRSKYDAYQSQYPAISAATSKRIFLTAKLHHASTDIVSYEIWIENCTFSPSTSEVSGGDFRKIEIPSCHPLLNETVVSYEGLSKPELPPSPVKEKFSLSEYIRDRSHPRFSDMRLYRALTPPTSATRMANTDPDTIPEEIPKFRLQYRACFPHCTTKIVDKEAPGTNLTFPVHPELTIRQLVNMSWTRLRKICYKNPNRNIEKALRVRFSIRGVSEEGSPALRLDLDAEGICCKKVENLALGGGVWESIFSRFKAQDAGIRYWEL